MHLMHRIAFCWEVQGAQAVSVFKSFDITYIVQIDFMTCPFALVMICCSIVFH